MLRNVGSGEARTLTILRERQGCRMATRKQIIDERVNRYVKEMVRKIKAHGELPYTITSDGVVADQRYGGGIFKNEHDCLVHVVKVLYYPQHI